jgi:hypothetical protein
LLNDPSQKNEKRDFKKKLSCSVKKKEHLETPELLLQKDTARNQKHENTKKDTKIKVIELDFGWFLIHNLVNTRSSGFFHRALPHLFSFFSPIFARSIAGGIYELAKIGEKN